MQNYRKTSHSVYDLKCLFGMDNEILQASFDGCCSSATSRTDSRNLQGKQYRDHHGSCFKRSCAFVRKYSTAYFGKQFSADAQREDIQKDVGRVQTSAKSILGRLFWARGYFVTSSGTITDEVIMEYIEKQDLGDKDEDFKISGEG